MADVIIRARVTDGGRHWRYVAANGEVVPEHERAWVMPESEAADHLGRFRVAYPGWEFEAVAPVAVDVPPGAPLHELARLAADAPEVRRETLTAPDLPCRLAVKDGVANVFDPRSSRVFHLSEAEAARRLLAYPALLAACEAAEASLDPYHAGQRHLREEIAGLLARLAKP